MKREPADARRLGPPGRLVEGRRRRPGPRRVARRGQKVADRAAAVGLMPTALGDRRGRRPRVIAARVGGAARPIVSMAIGVAGDAAARAPLGGAALGGALGGAGGVVGVDRGMGVAVVGRQVPGVQRPRAVQHEAGRKDEMDDLLSCQLNTMPPAS